MGGLNSLFGGGRRRQAPGPAQYFTPTPNNVNPGAMANFNPPRRTGLNLGINNPQNRAGFFAASDAGPSQLQDFLNQHKRIGARFQRRLQSPYYNAQANSFFQPAAPTTSTPPAPIDQGPRNPMPTDYSGAYNSDTQANLENMLPMYGSGIGSLGNKYIDNMNRGQFLDMPSFDELYGSYRNVAEREANRQAGNIGAGVGARGGAYSSDILNQQAGLKRDLFDQLANKASEYQSQLRGQQFGEVSSLANLQAQQRNAAFDRMMNQYRQQTALPPLFNPRQPTDPTVIVR